MVKVWFEDLDGNRAIGTIPLGTDDGLIEDFVTAVQALTCNKVNKAELVEYVDNAGAALTAGAYDNISVHAKAKMQYVTGGSTYRWAIAMITPKDTLVEHDTNKGKMRLKQADGQAFADAIKALTGMSPALKFTRGYLYDKKRMIPR
jgi:hypothetical protein